MDFVIFQFLHSFIGQSQIFDEVAIFFAKTLPYFLVGLAFIFILRRKMWKEKVFTFITVALTVIVSLGVITQAIRFYYDRPRPFKALHFQPLIENSSPSFPSAHGAFFFALALAVFYFDHRAGVWFFAFALLNSLARVALGLHWPSDILGSAIIALISFTVVQTLLRPYKPRG